MRDNLELAVFVAPEQTKGSIRLPELVFDGADERRNEHRVPADQHEADVAAEGEQT